MSKHLLIFGLGYTTARLAARLATEGWTITAIRREAGQGVLAFDDPSIMTAVASATHILSSVPPAEDADPVLIKYSEVLRSAPARWIGYLSSTGVYGDAGGAWVDEASPVGGGRRDARTAADLAWQAAHRQTRVFRLPGIYGPRRSAIDRVRRGTAQRIYAPGHRFSRIHVDDIGTAVIASFDRGAPGVYNLADADPAPGNVVIEYACDLLGVAYPPLEPLATARMSSTSRGFYDESRVVASARMHRELGVRLQYPDFRAGLRACLESAAPSGAKITE